MYDDPRYIRTHEVKVRFSDVENNLIDALIALTGQQRAVIVREMALQAAAHVVKRNLSRMDNQAPSEGL